MICAGRLKNISLLVIHSYDRWMVIDIVNYLHSIAYRSMNSVLFKKNVNLLLGYSRKILVALKILYSIHITRKFPLFFNRHLMPQSLCYDLLVTISKSEIYKLIFRCLPLSFSSSSWSVYQTKTGKKFTQFDNIISKWCRSSDICEKITSYRNITPFGL